MIKPNSIAAGLSYFVQGAGLLTRTGMKRFVLVPLIANIIVFIVLTTMLVHYFSSVTDWFNGLLSFWSWLAWLATFIASLLSALVFFLILLIYGFSFNIITNIIGAPFYGLLAEKIENSISDTILPQESISHMIMRTLRRELIKLWYFISRGIFVALGLFLLAFIPLFNLLVPILALLWGTWVMTLQYVDYPADNHQVSFVQLRQLIKQKGWSTIGLGGTIMLGSIIPVVNIFIMPIAVAGGTLFWAKELSNNKEDNLLANNTGLL